MKKENTIIMVFYLILQGNIKCDMDKDIPGYVTNIHDYSFFSSFSRSIKNLETKGLVTLTYHQDSFPMKNYLYQTNGKVDIISLTDKGCKTALMLRKYINNNGGN